MLKHFPLKGPQKDFKNQREMAPLWSYFPRCSLLFFLNSEYVFFCNQITAVLCNWKWRASSPKANGSTERHFALCPLKLLSHPIPPLGELVSWNVPFKALPVRRLMWCLPDKEQSSIIYCQLPTSEAKSFSTVGSFNERLESWVYCIYFILFMGHSMQHVGPWFLD